MTNRTMPYKIIKNGMSNVPEHIPELIFLYKYLQVSKNFLQSFKIFPAQVLDKW